MTDTGLQAHGVGSREVRVAMIGAGSMANRVHYPSLASFADVQIVAICDVDPTRLEETANTFGIAGRYTDYRKMVEKTQPDVVYAIGPPHIMYDIWVWCLRQGLHLFVEKPLGITMHQARIVTYLAEQNGCITQVGFQRRASPLGMKLRTACLERGPIVHAVCRFYKYQPEPSLGAWDHLLDDSVHAIDTLRWMCDGAVVDVQSTVKRVGVPDINFVSALLQFDNGATGLLLNSWTSGRRIFSVEMHAVGIAVEADLEGQARLYADGDTTGVEYSASEVAGSEDFHIFGGFQAKSREFIDSVKSGLPTGSNFADAFETMRVAETIRAKGLLVKA